MSKPTVLTDIVLQEFELQSVEEAPYRIGDHREIATFARTVYAASENGDQIAIDIIENAAGNLAKYAVGHGPFAIGPKYKDVISSLCF